MIDMYVNCFIVKTSLLSLCGLYHCQCGLPSPDRIFLPSYYLLIDRRPPLLPSTGEPSSLSAHVNRVIFLLGSLYFCVGHYTPSWGPGQETPFLTFAYELLTRWLRRRWKYLKDLVFVRHLLFFINIKFLSFKYHFLTFMKYQLTYSLRSGL